MIDDPYFTEMLNEDLSVWIEDRVFRVDPEHGKVYVIEADGMEENYDALVAENITDRDVKEYSSDPEALDIVKEQRDGPDGSRCSAPTANSHHTANIYLTDNTGRYAHSHYAKYGIYFTMFTRIDVIGSSAPVYQFDHAGSIWDGAPHVFYKARCGATADYSIVSTGSWTGSAFRYQSYQGSRALERLYFYVKIRSNYAPNAILAPQFGFRQNI